MTAFSQSELDELISCPKGVSEAPRREMRLCGAHWRNEAKLVASSESIKGEFVMFMRKNEDFPENFSIGLTYHPQDGRGEITLIRCNGPHGCFNSEVVPSHFDYHIHKASASAIEGGFTAEKHADKTTEYACYEDALQLFLKEVNVNAKDVQKYFRNETQTSLSFEE